MPLSGNQLRQLGRRLRETSLSAADEALLEGVLEDADAARAQVELVLREQLGLAPVGRVKSRTSLLDKLRRGTSLDRVQDLAGTRLLVEGGLADQDRVGEQLVAAFPAATSSDRRVSSSHGYRALHLVVPTGPPVEVQIRTLAQHRWAELMERLADEWGRGLRYGEQPGATGDPDLDRLRREAVATMMQLSELIAREEVSSRARQAERDAMFEQIDRVRRALP